MKGVGEGTLTFEVYPESQEAGGRSMVAMCRNAASDSGLEEGDGGRDTPPLGRGRGDFRYSQPCEDLGVIL